MMGFIFFFLLLMFFMFFFDLVYVFSLFFVCMFIFFLFGVGVWGLVDIKFGSLIYMDGLSFYLILLSFWVFSMVFLLGVYDFFCLFLVFLLFLFLVLGFMVSNVFWFYVFFECSMIPIFFIIMGWGSGGDRVFSAFYLLVYTMISSIPFLLLVLVLEYFWGVGSFDYFKYDLININSFFYFFFMFVFMVKMPIFVFHIWLPKAHVDAPVYGSMILASVMLKMGGYGMFRMLDMFGWDVSVGGFFYSLGLSGIFFVCLICLFSVDMKVIVAYSSVVHMCVMICSILSGCYLGYVGGFFMILSHGICSSGLFMMINILYSRSLSRLLFLNKGTLVVLPVFSFLWLFMIVDNMGAPPSLSFFSEVYCLGAILNFFIFSWIFVFLGLFLMSCISMNLFLYGFGSWFGKNIYGVFVCEFFLIFFHLFPLNMCGWFLGGFY